METLNNIIFITHNEYKQNIETNLSGDKTLIYKEKVSKVKNREHLKEYEDRFMSNAY